MFTVHQVIRSVEVSECTRVFLLVEDSRYNILCAITCEQYARDPQRYRVVA